MHDNYPANDKQFSSLANYASVDRYVHGKARVTAAGRGMGGVPALLRDRPAVLCANVPTAALRVRTARRERLAIPLSRSTWADLPAAAGERFDVVLCIGNSLVHAAGRDAMVQALTGLRQMARPGGHVVIDSRNWEKLHAERQIVQVADRVVARGGRRCWVLYAWEIPGRLGDEHIAHLVFAFDNGGRIEAHEHEITFRPFTIGELRERLELAGLREVDTDFDASLDRYAVVTVTT
jgi:SAM-dependent methyltransferase